MNRDEMVEALITDDINTIFDSKDNYNDESLLVQILEFGFKGYESFNMDELESECRERGLYDDGENIDIDINKTGGKW
jgi:hypothetical protein